MSYMHAHKQIKGATGAALWTWTDGTKGSDIASAITVGQDGTVVLAGYTSGFYGNKGTTAATTAAAAAAGAPATANAGLYDMVAIGLSGSKGKLLWSWQVGSERSLQNVANVCEFSVQNVTECMCMDAVQLLQ
jgi:hypothetical protein